MREHLVLPEKPTYELNEQAKLHDTLIEIIDGALWLTDEALKEHKYQLEGRVPLSVQKGANGINCSNIILGEKPDKNGVYAGDFLSINTHTDDRISIVEIRRNAEGLVVVASVIVDRNGHLVKGFVPEEKSMFRSVIDNNNLSSEDAKETVLGAMERLLEEYDSREGIINPAKSKSVGY